MKGDRENAVAKGKMEKRRRKEGGGIGVVGRRRQWNEVSVDEV